MLRLLDRTAALALGLAVAAQAGPAKSQTPQEAAHQLTLRTQVERLLHTLVLASKPLRQAHIQRQLPAQTMAKLLLLVLTEVLHITLQQIMQRLEDFLKHRRHIALRRLVLRMMMVHGEFCRLPSPCICKGMLLTFNSGMTSSH